MILTTEIELRTLWGWQLCGFRYHQGAYGKGVQRPDSNAADLAVHAILVAFPSISLFLANLMNGEGQIGCTEKL
jgi:hypothetical protein